jgi:hypothetical protein
MKRKKRTRKARYWIPSELAASNVKLSGSAWTATVKLQIDDNLNSLLSLVRTLCMRNEELARGVLDAIDAKTGDETLRVLLALKCDRTKLEENRWA